MSREKPKNIYKSTVTSFGNGAKIKGYKEHIGKEVIIMVKTKKKKCKNEDELEDELDKEMDKSEKAITKRWLEKDLY